MSVNWMSRALQIRERVDRAAPGWLIRDVWGQHTGFPRVVLWNGRREVLLKFEGDQLRELVVDGRIRSVRSARMERIVQTIIRG